jgi:hypothetical protein
MYKVKTVNRINIYQLTTEEYSNEQERKYGWPLPYYIPGAEIYPIRTKKPEKRFRTIEDAIAFCKDYKVTE